MRQAIITRYLCPTNNLGARVKAQCEAGTKIIHWDHADSVEENHRNAALALQNCFGWESENDLIGGSAFNGGFVFVQVPKKELP